MANTDELTISLCMVVRNEEEHLPYCLESVKPLVNEMIIVDTGSEDNTKEIASSYGANVIAHEWGNDFSLARNVGLDQAQSDWIFVLDADERLATESIPLIKELIKTEERSVVFSARILSFLTWERNPYDSFQSDKVRLFRNSKDLRFSGIVDEEVSSVKSAELKILPAEINLFHFGFLEDKHISEEKAVLRKKAVEKKPKDAFCHYNLGLSYYFQGNYNQAIYEFNLANKLCDTPKKYPFMASVFSLCADCLLEVESYEKARQKASRAVELSDGFAEGHYFLGKAYMGLDKTDLAVDSFKNAVKYGNVRHPFLFDRGTGDWKAYCELGVIYFYDEKYEDALDNFFASLSLQPINTLLLINVAHAYSKLGNTKKSENYFLKAFHKEPSRIDLCYELVEIYEKTGRFAKGIKLLEDFYSNNPAEYIVLYELANRYNYLNDFNKAISYYSRFIEIEPESAFAYLYRSFCYFRKNDYKKGIADLKTVNQLNSVILQHINLADVLLVNK